MTAHGRPWPSAGMESAADLSSAAVPGGSPRPLSGESGLASELQSEELAPPRDLVRLLLSQAGWLPCILRDRPGPACGLVCPALELRAAAGLGSEACGLWRRKQAMFSGP